MKKVSGNDNDLSKFVVNMVGCVTTKEPMVLILEYMKYGNLLEYLRYVRNRKVSEKKDYNYGTTCQQHSSRFN